MWKSFLRWWNCGMMPGEEMAKVYKTGPAKCGHGAAWLTGGTRTALYDSERGVREAAKGGIGDWRKRAARFELKPAYGCVATARRTLRR